MAELNNGNEGNSFLAVRLDIMRKEPRQGMIARNCVEMNSEMDLLWVNVSYIVGTRTIFEQEVLVHSHDLRNFTSHVEEAICNIPPHERERRQFRMDITSPELIIRLDQFICKISSSQHDDDAPAYSGYYEIVIAVEIGIEAGEPGVADDGPAMFFSPESDHLLAFIRDLRSETEMALLLD